MSQELEEIKNLWSAVLSKAIHDYRKKNNFRDSAKHWLFESCDYGIGSFRWVCDIMGVDISYVRMRANAKDWINYKSASLKDKG